MKKRVVIFSGYNQRAVIALLRTMERLNTPYCIVSSGEDDTVYKTKYKEKVIAKRKNLELDISLFGFVFELLMEKYPDEEFLIAPSTEALNRLFLQNRTFLQKYKTDIPLVESDLYTRISDKISFNEMCQSYGILVPRKLCREEIDERRFVAKPKYLNSLKTGQFLSPVLVTEEAQRRNFLSEHDPEDFFFEEYIDGESFYLLYYFFKDGEVLAFSQQNLLQQADGKSIVCAKTSNVHMEECARKFTEMFLKCGFRGLVMVELRKCREQYYMIEANPRMWGPSQLSVDAGVDFLHALLWDWGMTDVPISDKNINDKAKYCWLNGIKHNIVDGKQIKVLSEAMIDPKGILDYLSWDVYCREDTMDIYKSE